MELIPIRETLEENTEFFNDPLCTEFLPFSVDYYKKVGFNPPWICYFVRHNGAYVAGAAYKGKPLNNTVEISYGTFENFQRQGIGTAICKELVELSLKTDPNVRITARTLPENNYSVRILEKNNFTWLGMVEDPEDGSVWEWEFKGEH
jgi:RimJ/RimL family protein N-acetyltransferase